MKPELIIDSSPFFRCLICGGKVKVDQVRSGQGALEYIVLCSCGLTFAPCVSSKEKLLKLWNKGLIRDVDYKIIEHPFSFPSLFRSGHFYYFLGSVFFSAFSYFQFGFSYFLLDLGLLSFLYPFTSYVFTVNRLHDPVKTFVKDEFERLSSEAARESCLTQPEKQ